MTIRFVLEYFIIILFCYFISIHLMTIRFESEYFIIILIYSKIIIILFISEYFMTNTFNLKYLIITILLFITKRFIIILFCYLFQNITLKLDLFQNILSQSHFGFRISISCFKLFHEN